MSHAVRIPRHLAQRKPPHGAPCTACGVCCMAERCDLAVHLFGGPRHSGCPALMQIGEDFRCGLTLEGSGQMRAAAHWIIGAGLGCDCRINGEPVNIEHRKKCARWDIEHADEIGAARKLWGMDQQEK